MKARSLAILACLLCSASLAAPVPPGGSLTDRYSRALKALEETRANENQTREVRDRLAAEAADLQRRLIANAARVQDLEAALATTQTELERLNVNARAIESDLARDRNRVAHLLAVLQRLDADAPPALAFRPADSLGAARGAMVLGSMLPPVYEQAARLARQLDELTTTKAMLISKGATAKSQAEALKAARVDLDRLLQLRNRETASAEARLSELHGATEEFARTTGNLKNLIDRIATLRARGGEADQGMTVVTPQSTAGGELRRGSLRAPVVGQARPGDPAGPGLTPGTIGPSGLWYDAQGTASAVAPADSEVVFAGAYQKFGQVLILEISGGYHLTLAGLGRIDVHIGDQVLAGEPVGVLPEGNSVRLYMELRRNGQTLDPAPWMSAEFRKVK